MATNVSPKRSPAVPYWTSRLPDVVGLGGAIAGLGAGLVMAIIAAIISLVVGGDIWLEAKQIAAVFFGASAAAPGFAVGPIIVGTLLHLIVSALLGAVFGVALRGLGLPSEFGVPIVAGLIYGFLIWLLAYFVVLPFVNPYLLDTYAPAFIVQHLVFGGVLGLLYNWLRPRRYLASHDNLSANA